ncbi:MAG: hypothetical protein LBR67_04010 [Dysgonamonadaceae bacterium]|jgi:hypothetical protein|nr:hypothetical protein [Dysgonamonadaceae bacterium]
MKIKSLIFMLMVALLGIACNPIEDQSLREEFNKAGASISQTELDAALSVTQPIPNSDDRVEGDQYVVIHNSRPDIGGVWHVGTSTGDKIIATDHDTIIYGSNGEFEIYYVGVSENQVVTSRKFPVTVTNVFDIYDNYLSGAKDKADKSAKKTWTFQTANDIAYEGAHGAWKYYADLTPGVGKWWQDNIPTSVREQTMVFEYDGHKMTTYTNTGTKIEEGSWAYTHESPEAMVNGEFITTIGAIGKAYDGYAKNGFKYWILKISETDLVIYHPARYTGAGDWDDDGYYFFYKVKE